MNIAEYWPLDSEPRQTQIDAFNFFIENKDKQYFFIAAPVGTGKSAIGVTIANYLGKNDSSSYILTPQKLLQKQYEDSFNDHSMTSVYGRNNYNCKNTSTDCDTASTVLRCKNCPYTEITETAKQSKHIVLNYALALKFFTHSSDNWPKRNAIIMDECHQLENILTEHDILEITKELCYELNIPYCNAKNTTEIYEWIRDIFKPNFFDEFDILENEVRPFIDNKSKDAPFDRIKKFNTWGTIKCHVNRMLELETTDIEKIFVNVSDDKSVKFKYIFGSSVFHDTLQQKADKFIFLSATIFDHEEYCRNLNIPLNKVAFFTCNSDFPSENRPVVFIPTMKMSYGWDNDNNKENRKEMIKNIKQLLLDHKDDNGIIHTGNYQIAKWLVNDLTGIKHIVWHHNPDSGDTRDKIIDAFINSTRPSILISPSITEGLDLMEDKSRFAIFVKVSFGSLGDNWIKKRMDMSNNWYLLRALTDVIQGCGRVVRSKEDFGVCYILDSSWNYLYSKMKHKLPKWWLKGYHQV